MGVCAFGGVWKSTTLSPADVLIILTAMTACQSGVARTHQYLRVKDTVRQAPSIDSWTGHSKSRASPSAGFSDCRETRFYTRENRI